MRRIFIQIPYWTVRLILEKTLLIIASRTLFRLPQPNLVRERERHGLSFSRPVSSRLILWVTKILCYSGKDLRAAWLADGIPKTIHPQYAPFANWAAEHWAMYYSFISRYSPKGQIMDFGCGIGNMTANLAASLPSSRVLGLDLNKLGIEIGRTRFRAPNLELVHGDALETQFNEQFDYVFCIEVLEHVRPQDHDQLIGAAFKVLRPGGLLFLTTPNARSEKDHEWGHIGLLNSDRAADFFIRYKDQIEEVGYLDNTSLGRPDPEAFLTLADCSALGKSEFLELSHFWLVLKK